MSRHQPEHGADSAEALADVLKPGEFRVRGWDRFWEGLEDGLAPRCAACSLPAVTDGYCAGHARLFEYTDHERSGGIAANE
jgi:hypothetical protein